jgi:hypothetical protein
VYVALDLLVVDVGREILALPAIDDADRDLERPGVHVDARTVILRGDDPGSFESARVSEEHVTLQGSRDGG